MKTPAEVITALTGCKNADLVAIVLEAAEQTILSLTNRTKLIPPLEAARRDLAVVMINRLGTEGESSRSEGGISISFEEMPKVIQTAIETYRLARVCGHALETVPDQDV
ncbi:phage head-tail connector protein [Holdemania sp. 1001302B_160321_E10]|uniref:phage head-tail connector protein n=1 Tax=Holdemania sp. 1001302B_160321_E10 TaxID=2787120 RepID=UPI00189A3F70|nr:phage head-tail connector protein [Holdemania sp. 1001302B_160321_E10]